MKTDQLVETYILYRKLAGRMPALADAMGFPPVKGGLIQILYAVKDGERQVLEMADTLGITQQAIGKMVKEALKAGVVTTRVNEGDGRSRIVTITKVGKNVWGTFDELCIKSQKGKK